VSGQPIDVDRLTYEQQQALICKLLDRKNSSIRGFAMSMQQQGVWHAFRRDPRSTAYHVYMPIRYRSKLQVNELRSAIEQLSLRHASLRTTFDDEGGVLVQRVHKTLSPDVIVIDAENWDVATLRDAAVFQTQMPFDLRRGPLLRLAIFRVATDDWLVVATTHHIIVDFWSLILIMQELRVLCPGIGSATNATLGPPVNNYAEFVLLQQGELANDSINTDRAYWRDALIGLPDVIEIPPDRNRPKRFTGRGGIVACPIDDQTFAKMRNVATRSGVTIPAVTLSSLAVIISRHTRCERFVIGVPFSGRRNERFERTVGFFINLLPIPVDVSGDPTFAELVTRTSQALTSALDHENYPFAGIVQDRNPARDNGRAPLVQITCTFEKSHLRQEIGRASFLMPQTNQVASTMHGDQQPFYLPHTTCHHDLEFIFEQVGDSLMGMICYCSDLYDEASINAIADHYLGLVDRLASQPHQRISEVAWYPIDNQSQTVIGRADETSLPELRELLAASLDRCPEAIALRRGIDVTTYGALLEQANQVAVDLATRAIGRESIVPVIGDVGPASCITILGTCLRGAAVLPIDAKQPSVSIQRWESDCATIAIPDDLAYVIYTSGTTGDPKGVMIHKDAISNTLHWRMTHCPLRSDDRVIMLLSHQFDAGLGLILQGILAGAELIWPESSGPQVNIDLIMETMIRDRVTVLTAPPSLLALLVRHRLFTQCNSLRRVATGGESLSAELIVEIQQRSAAEIWNFYGPTEAAIEATAWRVPKSFSTDDLVCIGDPVRNMRVYPVDVRWRATPIGVPGQLVIVGPGVGRGYLGRDELTAQSFVTLPGGERGYLTGDLARIDASGRLIFMGREDDQVKVRGYRIELQEIESALMRCAGVVEVAVCVIGDGPVASLAAGLVLLPGADPTETVTSAGQAIADSLPTFKRPSRFHVVDTIPRTRTGKVDRARVAEIIRHARDAEFSTQIPPSSGLEIHLVRMWSDALSLKNVGVTENFFELGGSSLQAAMLASRMSDELGVDVPIALLFDLADIRQTARRLRQLHPEKMARSFGDVNEHDPSEMPDKTPHRLIAPLQTTGDRPPLFMIHPPGGIVLCYRELAVHMRDQQPLYAVRSRGLHGEESMPTSLEAMAREYVEAIFATTGQRCIEVGGWSLGGLIAIEVVRQLRQRSIGVSRLILLDTTVPDSTDGAGNVGLEYGIDMTLDQLSQLSAEDQLPYLYNHAERLGLIVDQSPPEIVRRTLHELRSLFHHHVTLCNAYELHPIEVPVWLARPIDVPVQTVGPEDRGWSRWASDLTVVPVPGHHHSMLSEPHVGTLAARLRLR